MINIKTPHKVVSSTNQIIKNNQSLRIKFGIDPTSNSLYLGHFVALQVLKELQSQGHIPVIIIGDFTAKIGDPSGRNSLRPVLPYAHRLNSL